MVVLSILMVAGLQSNLYCASTAVLKDLFEAIKKQETSKVYSLLKQYPDLIHQKDERGYTALHVVTLNKKEYHLDQLVKLGANVNAQTNAGNTPLHFANTHGHVDGASMALYLMDHGAKNIKNAEGLEPQDMDPDRILKAREKVAAAQSNNKLALAIQDKDEARFKTLLSTVPKLIRTKDQHGDLPLHKALVMKDPATRQAHFDKYVKPLVEAGAKVNVVNGEKESPLITLLDNHGSKQMFEYLVTKGAKVKTAKTREGHTVLHYRHLTPELAEFFISKGANVNATAGYYNETPLHEWSERSKPPNVAMVKLLLKHGARTNVKNKEGKTPFDLASTPEIEKILLQHKKK